MRAGHHHRPETLLTGMDAALTELVVLASAVLAQKERPFQTPFLAPAHRSCSRVISKENYLPSNPMNKLDTIKVEKIIKHDFSIPEIEDLRKVCETTRDRAMLEFLLSTGVRVSELCSLNVNDINLYNQEFKVMGKGRKERVIYVSEYCAYYLMKYFDDRMIKENITKDELMRKPLFVTKNKPYDRIGIAGVQFVLKTLGKKANVDNVHPHRFRRTFATRMLNKGMRIERRLPQSHWL